MNDHAAEKGSPSSTEAVDREPRDRPGVPMIPEQPAALTRTQPARQEASVPVLVSVDVGALTPVFSSAVPPRGLSGLMRRRAYAIHEHKARRWLLLLLADRVDVWENRARRHPWLFAGTAIGIVGLLGAAVPVRRSRR